MAKEAPMRAAMVWSTTSKVISKITAMKSKMITTAGNITNIVDCILHRLWPSTKIIQAMMLFESLGSFKVTLHKSFFPAFRTKCTETRFVFQFGVIFSTLKCLNKFSDYIYHGFWLFKLDPVIWLINNLHTYVRKVFLVKVTPFHWKRIILSRDDD